MFRWFCQIMDYSFLNIHEVWIDIAILALMFGFVAAIMRNMLAGTVAGLISAGLINNVCKALPDHVYRLQKILDNAGYILNFEENRKTFLASLGITNKQASDLQQILYYMDASDWEKAEKGAGSMKWYLEKIHSSLFDTVWFSDIHLGAPIQWQPLVIVFILFLIFASGFLIWKKYRAAGGLLLLGTVIALTGMAGTILYLVVYFTVFWIMRNFFAKMHLPTTDFL